MCWEAGDRVDSLLTQLGFGETQLAVPTGPADEPLNRRVELTLDRLVYTGTVNIFDDAGGLYTVPAQAQRGMELAITVIA